MSAREHHVHNYIYGHILLEKWTKYDIFIPLEFGLEE
jgi:hypothetical protein